MGNDVLYTSGMDMSVASAQSEMVFSLRKLREDLESINQQYPAEVDYAHQQSLENMEENVRTGMMTQEELDEYLEQSKQYATYVTDPPAGYSGSEE